MASCFGFWARNWFTQFTQPPPPQIVGLKRSPNKFLMGVFFFLIFTGWWNILTWDIWIGRVVKVVIITGETSATNWSSWVIISSVGNLNDLIQKQFVQLFRNRLRDSTRKQGGRAIFWIVYSMSQCDYIEITMRLHACECGYSWEPSISNIQILR